MRAISGLLILSLMGLLAAAPAENSKADETCIITTAFFPEAFLKYTGKHDIVNILVPLNAFNPKTHDIESRESDENISKTIFFVEADTTPEGKRIDQGLYILKEGKATKLLVNGRDAAASADNSTLVYFGASDGIYVYKNGSTEKYGSLSDNIIGIAKEKSGDALYILTENHEVYKVTESGNKKEKIDTIRNAKQIILDYANNLYFYSDDKRVQVLTSEGVKKITGLPENPASLTLVKPPLIFEEGVAVIVNNYTCMVYPNGTSERSGIEFEPEAKPSAYGSEVGLVQYHARDKKIYEYDVLNILLSSNLEELSSALNDNADTIRSLASAPKGLSR